MKKIHLVLSRLKSNHRNCEAAFESRAQALAYCSHMERESGTPYKTFLVVEVPLMDGTPEMNRIMLGFPEGT